MDKKPQIISGKRLEEVQNPSRRNSLVRGLTASSGGLARRMGRMFLPARRNARQGDEPSVKSRRRTLPNGYLLSFIAIVLIPSFASILYFAFLASNQYMSEVRFAVHSAQLSFHSDGDKFGDIALGGVPALANDDAYIISDYIGSRAILADLSKTIDVRAIFQRPEADFFARLKTGASAEELNDYWKKMVSAFVERTSGIVILDVRTFRPADSEALARAIISASEKLANNMSLRARRAIMKDAEDEVRREQAAVSQALLDLRKFRDKEGYIDPSSAATLTSTLLMDAMSQKIRLENEYYVSSRATSVTAPTVVALKSQLDAVDLQIEQLQSKLTSNTPRERTIAASLGTFEELELKRIFAEKLYTMAQDALERARLRAEQQNIYLSTFVPPALPQDADYPNRFGLSMMTTCGLLMIWAILAMLSASIEDHRN